MRCQIDTCILLKNANMAWLFFQKITMRLIFKKNEILNIFLASLLNIM